MNLDELFEKLDDMPTVPGVAQELLRQFDDPATNIDELARTIERDPVIAAKVLQLANSARFHGARDCTHVADAALRLGFNMLRTLVLASAVTGVFRPEGRFDLKRFWRHSFEVASIGRLLARQRGIDAEAAFICGMMHNLGELLIQTAAPEYAKLLQQVASFAAHAEDGTLQPGFGYPEVGAELARRWNLPRLIQHAIAYQARPMQAPAGSVMPLLVAQAVHIADALDVHGGIGDEARLAADGPLMDGVQLDVVFRLLPKTLEADGAFAEVLG